MKHIADDMSKLVKSLIQEKDAIYNTKDANYVEALKIMASLALSLMEKSSQMQTVEGAALIQKDALAELQSYNMADMRDIFNRVINVVTNITNKDCSQIVKDFDANVGKLIDYVEELNRKMDLHKNTLPIQEQVAEEQQRKRIHVDQPLGSKEEVK